MSGPINDRANDPSKDRAPPTLHARTLFVARPDAPGAIGRGVAASDGGHAAAARRAEVRPASSDVGRVRPAYAGALLAALGAVIGFYASRPAGTVYGGSAGPGPLTPPHAAKLKCKNCHGSLEPGAPTFVSHAKEACVDCHGAHLSTRAPHRALIKDGELGCVTCHTIHGPQSGVRFGDGPAVRYSTWGEVEVDGVSFRSGRTILVPTIPLRACARCHDPKSETDPIARCRSYVGTGDLEPMVCFDEHRTALSPFAQPDPSPPPRGGRDRDRRDRDDLTPNDPRRGRGRDADTRAKPKRDDAVCAEQHFEDRSFAWEAAREAVARVPAVARKPSRGSIGWLVGGVLGAALGYGGAALGERVRQGKKKKSATAKPPTPATAVKKRLPVIDTSTCLGCYACVDACPYGVFEVERYVAVVARPDACCGLLLCEQKCPNGSLQVGDEDTLLERPRVSSSLESEDVPGLYLAGDVTGVPLIKNAISQGVRAAEAAHRALSSRARASSGAVDVCVIGAGPAGISAALRLKELGATFEILDQGSVAQSIQNFPRGKLVFDQPLDLPVLGKLWLEESTKEELLMHWLRIIRRADLVVHEHHRMTGVDRRPDGLFVVRAVNPDGAPTEAIARSVIVAIGQRGSPRKLPVPIPEEAESRVHYHLADARSLAGANVVVVGLGDVAMEAAIALAHQPRTRVTLLARGAGFSRGQPRNIAEIERLVAARRVEVRFDTEVTEVQPSHVVTRSKSATETLGFDALFVMIGSIPPWDTLARVGIRRAVGEAHG
ncbi:MAG: NAD(P)-binding domain-containing protein [Polyangiaceae bacterium]